MPQGETEYQRQSYTGYIINRQIESGRPDRRIGNRRGRLHRKTVQYGTAAHHREQSDKQPGKVARTAYRRTAGGREDYKN